MVNPKERNKLFIRKLHTELPTRFENTLKNDQTTRRQTKNMDVGQTY